MDSKVDTREERRRDWARSRLVEDSNPGSLGNAVDEVLDRRKRNAMEKVVD